MLELLFASAKQEMLELLFVLVKRKILQDKAHSTKE
jgi:hypothetical protein